MAPAVVAGTLHHRMVVVSGCEPDESSDATFWADSLPQQAITLLLESESDEHVFDELIVDEAQDLLRDSYLDFMDLSLRGGLAAGRWRLFGDFEQQAIYNSPNLPLDEFLDTRGSHAPLYRLRRNCRNTPRIAGLAQTLSGLQPGYSSILRPDDLVEPEWHFYERDSKQPELLAKTLERLSRAGYRPQDIVVISTRSETSAAARMDVSPWNERLRPLQQAAEDEIGYCSIHAFKGLEAPVIVVTDVSRLGDPGANALLYVAVTRALHHLVILADARLMSEVAQAMRTLA
jgi:DNA helicase IV